MPLSCGQSSCRVYRAHHTAPWPRAAPQLRAEADNIWAIIDLKACTVEQRWTFPSAQSALTTPGVRRCLEPLPDQAPWPMAADRQ